MDTLTLEEMLKTYTFLQLEKAGIDPRTKKYYPEKYFTDKIFRTNYELKRNAESLEIFYGYLRTDPSWLVEDNIKELLKEEKTLIKRKSFLLANKNNPLPQLDFALAKEYPILDVVRNYGLSPVASGNKRYKICCPFHNEKTPSLVIFEEQNKFKCFGCGAGSDVLDFICKYENITVINAVKKILNI